MERGFTVLRHERRAGEASGNARQSGPSAACSPRNSRKRKGKQTQGHEEAQRLAKARRPLKKEQLWAGEA